MYAGSVEVIAYVVVSKKSTCERVVGLFPGYL
jgi:hypothetical protein